MQVPTSKQLSEELSVFDIKCDDDLLDKMLEQCITHRIQEDDVVLEWVAFSTTRGGLAVSMDNLHLFELEVLNKKVWKSRQTAVKKEHQMSNTRDFSMQEHVASRAAFAVPTSSASKAAIAVPTSPASDNRLDLKLIKMHDDLTRRPEIVGGKKRKRPLVTPQRYHTSTSPDEDRMENPKEPKARKFSTCNRDDLVEHLLQKKEAEKTQAVTTMGKDDLLKLKQKLVKCQKEKEDIHSWLERCKKEKGAV